MCQFSLRTLIFAGVIILCNTAISQTDFRPGYVISNSGDTLMGMVDYRNDPLMATQCRFKSESNIITEYTPGELIGYRFTDGKYYIAKDVNGAKKFLECLIEGRVDIYYMRDETGNHYYIDKEGLRMSEIPYEKENRYVNDRLVEYESKNHIGLLTVFMQDAPQLQSKINSMKRPTHKGLIKLAEEYNNTMDGKQSSIIYEKKPPLFNILPELMGQYTKYTFIESPDDKYYIHFGIIGHVWMPSLSEKLYFRTGFIYARMKLRNEIFAANKIPLQLEYYYPVGKFRPRIAVGYIYYLPNYHTLAGNLGATYQIHENISLTAGADLEFGLSEEFLFLSQRAAFSTQLGVQFNF